MKRNETSPTEFIKTQYDDRFRKRIEQLYFQKTLKEPTYVLPKPVEPIFKNFPANEVEKQLTDAGETLLTSTEDESEDEEEYGEYDTTYEEDDETAENFLENIDNENDRIDEELAHPATSAFSSPMSLVHICLKAIANNFGHMYKCLKLLPEDNLKNLFDFVDFQATDIGLAAKVINEESYWKRGTNQTWPGYHRPWARSKTWKIYFLEKWLAQTVSNLDPEGLKIEEIQELAKKCDDFIYCLNINGLKAPRWPTAVDIDSSSDEAADSAHEIDSEMSLGQYLNRRINYFQNPSFLNRLQLDFMFRQLSHLTHLNFSFGYDNFSLDKSIKFAKTTDDDALNLGRALAVCPVLYCFKMTRSKLTPSQLDNVLFGLYNLESFKEIELTNLFLTDDHMMTVTNLLKIKQDLRILCLKNNSIGPNGLARILHTIVLRDCKLKIFDTSMNPLGDAGGCAMVSLLAKKNRHLKNVYMSGTGLTHVTGYNFGVLLYFDKCLEVLDLSANRFDDFAVEALLKGLEHNYHLKRIDLRECGIPHPTLREMEGICFRNKQTSRKKSYTYPEVIPKDFWSGFENVDSEVPDVLNEEGGEDPEETRELSRIFVWATAPMKPRNRFMLLREIHALMKKSLFTTCFDVVVDKLILIKQKEIIQKAKMDSKREKDERVEGSSMLFDYSMQEYMRRSEEKLRSDFSELEALQVLKDANRCGRIDVLFKSMTPEKREESLKNIGKILFNDTELPSPAGMSLPFAKKWYQSFPDPEPVGGGTDNEEEYGEDEKMGEEEELGEFESKPQSIEGEIPIRGVSKIDLKETSTGTHQKISSPPPKALLSGCSKSTAVSPGKAFSADEEFQAIRDQVMGVRGKFKKWPMDEAPKFPKVIPFEIVKNCLDELPGTESEKEDDLPYWTDQWLQKF